MQLQKIITITGQIVLKTGLHIGGSKDEIEIGGIDNPVIKHPLRNEPYIPGSSLKGKMRCLMEYKYGRLPDPKFGYHVCGDKNCPVCRLFGTSDEKWEAGPTRLVVRDALLNKDWADKVMERGVAYTEEKTENAIDRLEGKAKKGGLRNMERVPAGAKFDFEISLRVFDIDDESVLLKDVACALRLLELDTLGGSGSRGYGKIAFKKLEKLDGEKTDFSLPQNPFEG